MNSSYPRQYVIRRRAFRVAWDMDPIRRLSDLRLPVHQSSRYLATRYTSGLIVTELEMSRIFLSASPDYARSRYGDGSYPVLYASLDERTCLAEVVHHLVKMVPATACGQVMSERVLLEFEFGGDIADLRELCNVEPKLLHDCDYSVCWRVAKEVIDQGADGLFAVSARLRSGINVAIFNKRCVRDSLKSRKFELTYEPSAGKYEIHWAPASAP